MADCLQCEAPEAEAPDLLAVISEDNPNTYFVRQPETEDEVERACMAARVCCTSAIRYGGKDKAIINRLGNSPEYCDYFIDADGKLRRTVGDDGDLLPLAHQVVENYRNGLPW